MLIRNTLVAALMGAAAILPANAQGYDVEVLAEGLDRPWGMEFLPGGRDIVITSRGGSLMLWDAAVGEIRSLDGTVDVDTRGQGGLLDIALAPDFADSGIVYLTWSANTGNGLTTTTLGRGVLDLDAGALRDVETLFQVSPAMDSQAHYGSRIAVQDGFVYVSTGDRNQKDFGPDHIAQDLSSENGAVLRLALDGTIPDDNPFVGQDGASGAIWSYGHRNIQALAFDPSDGQLWLAEHGEAGGDEINRVERGGNFGWPLVGYGVDYRTGQPFADLPSADDPYIAPAFNWPPGRENHFPPSGMAFYDGDAFGDWQGNMFIGGLYQQFLARFSVEDGKIEMQERLLDGMGYRIRDVAAGPEDGLLYVLTDGEGAPLLRLSPTD
jgi:glucose/arabinose dehydrogenase